MTASSGSGERLAAFQYRDYTIQWIGQVLSLTGTQMQLTAVDWHVYTLLRGQNTTLDILGLHVQVGVDKLGLGGLGLVRIVPVILFALFGGVIADMTDRRRILIWSQVVAAIFGGTLAYLTLSGHESILAIYLLSGLMAAVTAFSNPARQAFVANLVERRHLANAMTLNNVMWQVSTIAGPALAGVTLAAAGPGIVYLANAISFGAMLVALLLLKYRYTPNASSATLSRVSLIEGIRFTFDSRVIRSTMLLDFFATFFASARTMLPVVATEVLHADVNGFAVLSTAQSVGAVITALVMSLRREVDHQGFALLVSVAIYGFATALFGLSGVFTLSYLALPLPILGTDPAWFSLSYFLLAITGAGDTVSTVIRSTLRQVITPDHLRGRITGVNMIFFSGGPQLGELEAGVVAALGGVPLSIISGGILTVALTALIAWQYPTLRNYMREGVQPETAHA